MKTVWKVLLIIAGIMLILAGCAVFSGAAYWFGTTRVVAEKPVAVATEQLAIVQLTPFQPSTATPMVVMPTQPAPVGCRVIHEGPLSPHSTEVATSGSHIHVEWYFQGQPEYETILTASDAAGGRFLLEKAVTGGWVWEYKDCSYEQVFEQIQAHIQRRLAGGVNNGGFVGWESTGLFQPAK